MNPYKPKKSKAQVLAKLEEIRKKASARTEDTPGKGGQAEAPEDSTASSGEGKPVPPTSLDQGEKADR